MWNTKHEMIKQYTWTTVAEHDNDYPDYRPNHIPAGTCGYPYHLVYPTAYPTNVVNQVCRKKEKKKKHEKICPFMLVAKITILILILLCVFNLIKKN